MNRENIQKVRDVIAGLPPERFDMRWLAKFRNLSPLEPRPLNRAVLHSCNTVACIAGWTNALFGEPTRSDGDASTASALLGLSPDDGEALFCPDRFQSGRYSRDDAVRVLDHLLATGAVDWSVADGGGTPSTPGAEGEARSPGLNP